MLKVLISGAIFNIVNILIQIILGMLVFREMLLHFGEHDFGQWTFIFAILAHIMLFEFGLGSVISKLTPILKREHKNLSRFSTAIVVIFGIGLIFLAGIGIASIVLSQFPNMLEFDADITLAQLLFLLGANFVFTFQAGAVQAYLTGKFKVGSLNLIKISITILRTVGILGCLNLDYGVLTVAIIFAASAFLQVLAMMLIACKAGLLSEFSFSECSKDSLRYIANRGSRYMFMSFNGYVRNNAAIIICGIVIGAIALVPLRIAGRLIEIYGEVLTSIIYMLTPYFSSINSDKKESLDKSFQISVAASSFVSSVIFINMYFLGHWFLEVWLGQVPTGTYEILITLAAGFCFANAQAPCTPLMIAKDRNNDVMLLSITEIIVLFILIYPMIAAYGVIGSAYATFISLIISRGILQPILITRTLNISFSRYFFLLLTPMITIAVAITCFYKLSAVICNMMSLNDVIVFLLFQAIAVGTAALFLFKKYKTKKVIM